MNVKQYFTTATALKAAVTDARSAAKVEAEKDCGRGCLISRGAYIRTFDAKGDVIKGEAESWEFTGKADQVTFLGNLLRYDTKVVRITIEGGWNWATNPRDYADGDYQPWVSEWAVVFGETEEEQVAPAPVSDAAVAQALVDLRTNMAKAEAAIAALEPTQWVILWGASVLRTDGEKVGLLGASIYTGARWMMEQDAEKWAEKVTGLGTNDTVAAMPASKALAAVKASNAQLLDSIPALVGSK
jgi:hypothetical protein